jgi:hypothetical protein
MTLGALSLGNAPQWHGAPTHGHGSAVAASHAASR